MPDGLPIQGQVTQVSPNMRGFVQPVAKIVLLGGIAKEVFRKGTESGKFLQYMRIQNVDLGIVKVCIDGNDATADQYQFLLKGDTAAEAGNGGVCEIFGSWDVQKVSVFTITGSFVAITKVTTTRSGVVNNQ